MGVIITHNYYDSLINYEEKNDWSVTRIKVLFAEKNSFCVSFGNQYPGGQFHIS